MKPLRDAVVFPWCLGWPAYPHFSPPRRFSAVLVQSGGEGGIETQMIFVATVDAWETVETAKGRSAVTKVPRVARVLTILGTPFVSSRPGTEGW